MKQETNNEMDLLLRRLGRRPDIPLSDANGDVDHLDADELNAYAENVLPPAARARYTEHLAECSRCRELVVQLSSAAGLVPVVETAAAAGPSALKRFLASLFSPMVLRYAVPALGLILIAAVGLFVFRQREEQRANTIAENVQPQARTSSSTSTAPKQDLTQANGNLQESTAKPAKSSGSPENERTADAVDAPADTSRDALAKKADQPVTAAEPPAPKPTGTSDQKQEAIARKEPTPQAPTESVNVQASADKVEQQKAAEVKPASSAPAASTGGTSFGVNGAQGVAGAVATTRSKTRRPDSAADKDKAKIDSEDDANAETKTVAGRRFRKQGGVWVDTAYNFSRNATSLTRGSEQFRALIADEPEIKTIADQLDGEILVVWKGRPYRIK